MELQHINVKIYVAGELPIAPARFIDVFHQWVKDQSLEEMLIDVADYRHVPAGPGVLLVGHEADYGMDHADERWGLLYNRKAPVDGCNADRLRQALGCAVRACRLLEDRFAADGSLKFDGREFELFVNDRALAPNTPETYAVCEPELRAFLSDALGHDDFALEHRGDPRSRFGVTVKISKPFDLQTLQQKLGAQA